MRISWLHINNKNKDNVDMFYQIRKLINLLVFTWCFISCKRWHFSIVDPRAIYNLNKNSLYLAMIFKHLHVIPDKGTLVQQASEWEDCLIIDSVTRSGKMSPNNGTFWRFLMIVVAFLATHRITTTRTRGTTGSERTDALYANRLVWRFGGTRNQWMFFE